jgi:ABC-type glycerol-3-phosphate transport system substrate-binding protein
MSQHGLSFYNKELNATAFSSKAAIDVFEYWTDFYSDYGFLKEADFYNRMRVGVMPLGIAPYSVYMTLYSAAPEIQGRWAIAAVPGIKNTDGTINRTVAGAGTGCSIVKKSKNREEAWEFLKWWTDASTQSAYTNNVESILGMIGRTATANVEAFSSLPWENDDLSVLLDQWSYLEEIPEIPGSYYLTRAVDQAFWSVVNGESRAKDAIVKWSKVADDEIKRKIKEYS